MKEHGEVPWDIRERAFEYALRAINLYRATQTGRDTARLGAREAILAISHFDRCQHRRSAIRGKSSGFYSQVRHRAKGGQGEPLLAPPNI